MEQYQNTFDAIHASEIFKRRMVAMMQEHNEPRMPCAPRQAKANGARISRGTRKKRRTQILTRRILFAAACLLLVAAVSVMAIPSARAAVSDWISGWFSAGEYFRQEKEARTEEPKIEAITTTVGENSITISNVGEEFKAYADAFDMKLDEVAYDGESIFLSGTMSGATARPFVEAFTGGDTFWCSEIADPLSDDPYSKYDISSCENRFSLETANGTYIGCLEPNLTKDMDSLLIAATEKITEPVFQDGKLVTTNAAADELWDKYLANHDVRFSVELRKVLIDMKPLTGMVDGDVTFSLYYANEEGDVFTQVLLANFGKITIDANAYQAQTQTTQAKAETSVELGGVHPVTIQEWQPEAECTSDDCEVYYYTRELDFTGAKVALKEITFTPTDTKITLHITLPESWSREERRGCRLTFHPLFDNQKKDEDSIGSYASINPGEVDSEQNSWLEYDFVSFESNLSPSQWSEIKTLTLIPTTVYWWDMQVNYDNGPYEPVSLKSGVVYTSIANHSGLQYEELYDEMTQYALTIQLDDYR
jgi:hypothetical protein